MHRDFFADAQEPVRPGAREAIAAPRGHAKTTFKALLKVIHAIVYGYQPYIIILGHSASEAEEKAKDILDQLEGSERLIQVYGALAPVPGKREHGSRWGKKWFITQNGIKVQAKSRGAQIRGLKHGSNRPSLVICDDIESPDGVLNPDQRKKTWDWFMKDVLKCGQIDGSTNFTVIGTCLHPDALLPGLLQSVGWHGRKYQAVLSDSERPDLWATYQGIYTNLSEPQRKERAQAFFEENREAMLAGTQVLWPEAESYERLMNMKIEEGEASFSSEKQNDPYDPELQLFKMDQARRCRILYDGRRFSGIQWLGGTEKIVPRADITRIVAYHDPALGKKPGAAGSNPDYAAIVVVAQDKDGYMYALDAWIEKKDPSTQVAQALLLYDKWGFETLYLEVVLFQDLLRDTYARAQEKRDGKPVRVIGVTPHTNKIQRISMLEPDITNGYLLFADTLNPRLISQLTLFPTTHDDGPDALHGAVSQLKKRLEVPVAPPIQVGSGEHPHRLF